MHVQVCMSLIRLFSYCSIRPKHVLTLDQFILGIIFCFIVVEFTPDSKNTLAWPSGVLAMLYMYIVV